MVESWVYRKTERGQQAIKERSSFLTPQLRSLLIMVDGVKLVSDLRKFAGVMGDVDVNLGKLADEGLIEAPQAAMASMASPAVFAAQSVSVALPVAGNAAAAEQKLILQDFQRQAVRAILDGMGPMAEPICERLERAKTEAEALSAASIGVQMLKDSRRAEAAQKLQALMARLA